MYKCLVKRRDAHTHTLQVSQRTSCSHVLELDHFEPHLKNIDKTPRRKKSFCTNKKHVLKSTFLSV